MSRPSHRSKSKYFKNWTQNQTPHRIGRGRPPEVAEGAGEVLRPGGGGPGRMSGAEPGVDCSGAGPQVTAETSNHTKNEQKETSMRGRRMRARTGAGSEWECHVEIEWIGTQLLAPHLGG